MNKAIKILMAMALSTSLFVELNQVALAYEKKASDHLEERVLLMETDAINNNDFQSGFIDYASDKVIKDYKEDYAIRTENTVNVVGIVKDYETDRLLQGATISVEGYSAITDENGRFQIKNYPEGKYDWTVYSEKYLTARYKNYEICAGDGSVIFTFYISRKEKIERDHELLMVEKGKLGDCFDDHIENIMVANTIPNVDSTIQVSYNGAVRNVGRQVYIYTVVSSELCTYNWYSNKGLTSDQINQLHIAQAVVANTFLEYSCCVYSAHSGESYDVCSGTCCQVYDPTKVTQTAVNATAEIFYYAGGIRRTNILMYHPNNSTYQYIYGAFFSSCGNQGTFSVSGQPALQHVSCSDLDTGAGGHRKGMCQMGAAKLAKNGSTVSSILNHYFTDCVMAACPLN